ncbi:MAG TPA: DUF3617 family protein [Candidatus Polarisedimenticolaceae bacterium]|nr:DUF3617 family protein [Candidatus Polarisedimenticolaceae bacterium]
MTPRSLRRAVVLIAIASGAPAAFAQAQPTGDLWEVTTKISMPGMEIPGHTSKVCSSKEWDKPPIGNDAGQGCTIADFKRTGTKASWTMRCDGPPELTGQAEIDRTSTDRYTGWMKIVAPQGTMSMTMEGKRLGDCDAGESKQ